MKNKSLALVSVNRDIVPVHQDVADATYIDGKTGLTTIKSCRRQHQISANVAERHYNDYREQLRRAWIADFHCTDLANNPF
jgi:hypothetical protein